MSLKKQPKKKSKVIQKAPQKKVPTGRGGSRPGAGRKPKKVEAPRLIAAAKVIPEVNPDELFESLPLKQKNFIVNYLINGFNATNAAKDAGFSARSADTQGSRLLKNAKVAAVIAARTKNSLAKRELSAQLVLDKISEIAFTDGIIPGELEPVKTKDRLKGLELLGRYFKLFTDKVEHKHTIERVVVKEALKKERVLPPSEPEF